MGDGSDDPARLHASAGGPLPRVPAGVLGDVLERVSDALVALDANWHYTFVNRQAAALFGRTPEDLIGRHIWTEFPEGLGQPFHRAYEQAMAEQVPLQIENYYEPWDRWFENRIYPSPQGLSIFFHEITDRKRAEREARDNAALLEAQNQVLENIARGAPLEHSLEMLLRFIEAACPEMLCSIVLPASDREHVRHAAAPSLPPPFISALEGDLSSSCPTNFVESALKPDPIIVEDIAHDPLWNDCRDVALAHGIRAAWTSPISDARGGIVGTFAVYARVPGRPSARHRYLIDVATQTAATALINHRDAEARRVSDERLRLAVTGGNVGIWEWDVVNDCFELSDQLREMFGWRLQADPITLEHVLASIHRDDRLHVEQALERSVNLGVDFDIEHRVVGPGGAVRWVAIKGAGEYHERSTPVRMMGVALDITTRKETEIQLRQSEERLEQTVATRTAQLRSRNEELKAFAYTVSHDLKAPLRGIAGYASELERRHSSGLDARGRHCLTQILTATRNLDRLVEDLLHYARLDAETPTPIEVDLAKLVDGLLRDRRPVIAEQGSDVAVDLAVPRLVAWERGLNQALANLIDNALKYSRQASPPRIRIASEQQQDAVRLIVSDNGIGFDQKYAERIFGLFNRLVRPEEFEGTGAGLAIVRKLVEKMGGTVRAESAPGAGATFLIDLPSGAAAAQTSAVRE